MKEVWCYIVHPKQENCGPQFPEDNLGSSLIFDVSFILNKTLYTLEFLFFAVKTWLQKKDCFILSRYYIVKI